MLYELISTEDYERLPDDAQKQFIEIEQICRRNMNQILDADQAPSEYSTNNLRMQYMMNIASAASELGVDGIVYPREINNMNYEFEAFMLDVSGVVTRLRLRGLKGNKTESVRLSLRTRGLIELRIRKLREAIETGEMPIKKRDALIARLDALLAEINSPARVSFAKVMTALAFIMAGTSGIADAPLAIANITEWLGLEKEAEDAETLRLSAPMQAIEHKPDPALPPERPRRPNRPAFDPEEDSDIPF